MLLAMRLDPQAAQSLRGELKAAEDAVRRALEDCDRAAARHADVLRRIKDARDADIAYWNDIIPAEESTDAPTTDAHNR